MNKIQIENPNFRTGTDTHRRPVIFKFTLPDATTCALGDAIAWLPAVKYVLKTYNYVDAHLIVPEWFHPIVQNVLGSFAALSVHTEIPEYLADGIQIREQKDFPNAAQMHLVDLGFLLYAGMNPPPQGHDQYLQLDTRHTDQPFILPQDYAVITPCFEASNRKIPADTINKICAHLVSKNITPVFIGKMDLERRSISLDPQVDLALGINLINKTTLMQAARIIENSKMIIGVDNGLLHLAAMTDATILYGFTMVGPRHRRIKRPHGHTVELYPDKAKLSCTFCQEHIRFFIGHDFRTCLYNDNACVKALNAESWIANINMILDIE